jgi:hypothetical protein
MLLYLKEEVQAGGIVRNIGDFARFETMSFSHASVIISIFLVNVKLHAKQLIAIY